jgi:hypothetical protein
VEGHELNVLLGATTTIERWRPIVFIELLPRAEYDELNEFAIFHRYCDIPLRPDRPLAVADEISFDTLAWNHALVPAEAAESFCAWPDPALR